MSNIKVKVKRITVIEYITTDGKILDDRDAADIHQDIIDGKKKLCGSCFGSKQITSWDEEFRNSREVNCGECSAKGYLELKWT